MTQTTPGIPTGAEEVTSKITALSGVTDIKELTVVGQGASAWLYFVGTKNSDTEVWYTNGTQAGHFDINATGSSNPSNLTNITDRLFFVAGDTTVGGFSTNEEVWSFTGIPTAN